MLTSVRQKLHSAAAAVVSKARAPVALGVHVLRGEAQPGLDMAGVKVGAMEDCVSVTPCSAEVGILEIWSAVVTLVQGDTQGNTASGSSRLRR